MNVELARFNMIEQQIRPWNVLDPAVLDVLARVPREAFVPAAYRALAFVDTQVPLPEGQCMLEPRVEARLLQSAAPQPDDRVLEIGTGSGYMAALLARRARSVTTFERRPALAALARANLGRAGIANAMVRDADGSRGAPGEAPFDVIVLSGSVACRPEALFEQLREGGRLVAIIGDEPVMRAELFTRGAGGIAVTPLFDTIAPRLEGFEAPSAFRF